MAIPMKVNQVRQRSVTSSDQAKTNPKTLRVMTATNDDHDHGDQQGDGEPLDQPGRPRAPREPALLLAVTRGPGSACGGPRRRAPRVSDPVRFHFFGRSASMALRVSAYLGDSSATSCLTAFLNGVRSLTGVTVTPPALIFSSASIS